MAKKDTGNNKIKSPKVTLPKGGGEIQGMGETFSPNPFTGSPSFTVPIEVTKGRGVAPHLEIDYSPGHQQGVFGLGFSLSLPEVSRQTSKGIPKYEGNDTFLLTGNDYLVPDESYQKVPVNHYQVTRYLPRLEEKFDRIEHWQSENDGSFWKVTKADHTIQIFGKSATAQIADPNNKARVFKWLLEETYDAKGNHILYEWTTDQVSDISSKVYEKNRGAIAERYISRISYGNDQPIADSIVLMANKPTVDWHFMICFDYGGYDLSNPGIHPANPPATRPDPFSKYHAGFEIRNYRLCQHVLLFHQFTRMELGTADPVLVRSWAFDYDTTTHSRISLLKKVQMTGYRYHQSKYSSKSKPAITLSYADFNPENTFHELREENGSRLVGVEEGAYQLVDLLGEGLPGVLYDDGKSVLYQEPHYDKESTVSYASLQELSDFPSNRDVHSGSQTLTDVTGNGRMDLLVSTPGKSGFYEQNQNNEWMPYQPFPQFPTDYSNPLMKHADIDGSGLLDLIMIRDSEVRVARNMREQGYAVTEARPRDKGLPTLKKDNPIEDLRFADLAGAGTPQLVRIANGTVNYWPSLGYGKFGQMITMGIPPEFGADFDTSRLFFADTDGSGTADLIYLFADKACIYFNQNGNEFSAPVEIPLPIAWDQLDHVHFADINGSGTTSMVFTKTHQIPNHWYCDFSDGMKPYLLTGLDNNMGRKSLMEYASSTRFYLEDKQNGTPWTTRLTFPVQVLVSETTIDEISKTETVISYRYRDGYYDGTAREFRGFGRVDRTDKTTVSSPYVPDPDAGSAALNPPPLLTKTWYHTGAFLQGKSILEAFQKEFWQPADQALRHKLLNIHTLDFESNVTDLRGAYRSLHGQVIRVETYGIDSSPWQEIPYTVAESQFCIREIQEKGQNRYGVYYGYGLQHLLYDYERNAADPKITHGINLAVDAYGNKTDHLTIEYGRRKDQVPTGTDTQTSDQQTKTWIKYEKNTVANQVAQNEPFLLGVLMQKQLSEITAGLKANSDGYYDLATVRKVFTAGQGFKPSVTLDVYRWSRNYYYDPENQVELPLGKFTTQRLLSRTEQIVLPNPLPSPFTDGLPVGMVKDVATIVTNTDAALAPSCGYMDYKSGEESRYYWDPGASQIYNKASGFYLPRVYVDQFGNQTTYGYDTSVSFLFYADKYTDANGNVEQISGYDFFVMQPSRLVNDNGNTAEVLYDELGIVIVHAQYGTEGTANQPNVGFDPIMGADGTYEIKKDVGIQDVLDHPEKYLQMAGEFFYYDLLSYTGATKQPPHIAHIKAEQYPTGAPGDPGRKQTGMIQVHLAYSDGFGRMVQAKTKVLETPMSADPHTVTIDQKTYTIDPKTTPRWLTSGLVRYNRKGKAFQRYEPYFIDSSDFTYYLAGIPESTIFYDALGRVVIKETPRNKDKSKNLVSCFQKTLYGELLSDQDPDKSSQFPGYVNQKLYAGLAQKFVPSTWCHLLYDPNNTLASSSYYEGVQKGTVVLTDPNEQTSLDKALKFNNYPNYVLFDAQEKKVETGRINASAKKWSVMSGSQTYITRNIQGDELTLSDVRLHPKVINNIERCYTFTQIEVKSTSVDAGTRWMLHSVADKEVWSLDGRGTQLTNGYDVLHRLIWKRALNDTSTMPTLGQQTDPLSGKLNQIIELVFYGDTKDKAGNPIFSDAKDWNLINQPVIRLDTAGLRVLGFYSILEKCQIKAKTFAENYKDEVDWTQAFKTNALGGIAMNTPKKSALTDYLKPFKGIVNSITSQLNLNANTLASSVYISADQFDALERPIISLDPDGNQKASDYNSRGLLDSLKITLGTKVPAGTVAPTLTHVEYNERGQRLAEKCGGLLKQYTYDPYTFRLINIRTIKGS